LSSSGDNNRSGYQARLNAVENFVAQHPDRPHSLEALAELAHLSKFHFHRVHHALTGETVQAMVNRVRLEAAAATLVYQKTRSITDVALAHGFSSSANFTRAFTRHFNVSPSAYRTDSKIGKAPDAPVRDAGRVELAVDVVEQPEVTLAYLRRRGSYVHNEIEALHVAVANWVESRGCAAAEPMSLGVMWSDSAVADEEHWVYDACVAVQPGTSPDREVALQTLAAGRIARIEVPLRDENHQVAVDLGRYWDWLVRDWWLSSGYGLRSVASYERYLEGERVQLCLPIN